MMKEYNIEIYCLNLISITEKQKGWWKLIDAEHVRQLHHSLMSRGIREGMMKENLRKYMHHIFKHVCTSDSSKTFTLLLLLYLVYVPKQLNDLD